jgi:alpha-N-arabinofuranosidase
MHLRNRVAEDYKLDGGLFMRMNKNPITALDTVSYLCIRQQHKSFDATVQMQFLQKTKNETAGLVIFQSNEYNYQFVLASTKGKKILRVIKCEKDKTEAVTEASVQLDSSVYLRISAREQELSFSYSLDGESYTPVLENADARILNTDTAGGFVGNTIGMYAHGTSKNHVEFLTFDYSAVL